MGVTKKKQGVLGQRFGAISLIGKSGEDRKNHEKQVPGSLGPWVSWSLGLWASGPLVLWVPGSQGLVVFGSLGLWASGFLLGLFWQVLALFIERLPQNTALRKRPRSGYDVTLLRVETKFRLHSNMSIIIKAISFLPTQAT